jgi:site-specific DNA-methyltransferase (adenine-specific)
MEYITLKSGRKWPLNTAYEGDFMDLAREIPDKSVGLIMADPPYFEVKGEFDFIWESFDDYLKDVEKWAIECKRILSDNGSLFWWGHAKKIAYSQVILDKYFHLENSIVWHKIDAQTNKNSPENMRSFKPVTERVLFYSLEIEKTSLQEIYDSPDCFKPIKEYMRAERRALMEEMGFSTVDEFNIFIREVTNTSSVVDRHYFADSQYCFPTKDLYMLMQTTGFFRREYEELRREYEELRRPFYLAHYNFNDIIPHSQESNISRFYDHDTIKPLTLIKKLLQTTTRKDTIVFIPFLGSWTSAVACYELCLKWFGAESNKKHFSNGLKRYQTECLQHMIEF